ncbi:MAG: hypothetical protein D8M59_00715 [Planctomycetes bacterium]|nr:hypothetical protein [Planctomycetota bacterium]NOG54756.1 hypothetical protein [Planctomycetota bacterium]
MDSRTSKYGHRLAVAGCAASLMFLSGCLISGGRHEQTSGMRLSQASMSQIEIGSTTSAWVEAAFGHPTSRQTLSRPSSDSAVSEDAGCHVEVWRYEWTKTVDKSGEVFLILDSHDRLVESTTVYLEFTDGVVTRYWTETTG